MTEHVASRVALITAVRRSHLRARTRRQNDKLRAALAAPDRHISCARPNGVCLRALRTERGETTVLGARVALGNVSPSGVRPAGLEPAHTAPEAVCSLNAGGEARPVERTGQPARSRIRRASGRGGMNE